MKKLITSIFLVTLMAALLTACGGKKISKDDAALMAGKWDLVLADMYGVKMLPEDIESQMSFEFKDNGKTTYTLDGETEDYNWEKDESLITIWVKDGGVSKGHTATLDGDSFTLYWDYDGEPIKMIYAREGSDAVNPDLYITDDDITVERLQNADGKTMFELLGKLTPEALESLDLTESYDTLKSVYGTE